MAVSETTLASLQEDFRAIQRNPAYLFLKRKFEDEGLRSVNGDMQRMAELHIEECAIKRVFRAFDDGARENSPFVPPEEAALLEPEDVIIDNDEDIFN